MANFKVDALRKHQKSAKTVSLDSVIDSPETRLAVRTLAILMDGYGLDIQAKVGEYGAYFNSEDCIALVKKAMG